MHCNVEIDQSGKVERTQTDTVLAFANGQVFAICIPATVKRAALEKLRQKHKSGAAIYLRLFAAGLYLLIKDHLRTIDRMVIDTEYTGQEANIRGMLLRLIRQAGVAYTGHQIEFYQVGKDSPAHALAWAVHRGTRKADHVVTEAELNELL
jgi:hypothetical protein